MTIDNTVTSISYGGNEVTVTGTLTAWKQEKTFTFSTCDRSNPGSLTVVGVDLDSGNSCQTGGMVMHCTCDDDTFNPWHNFVSNTVDWKQADGSAVCTSESNFIQAAIRQNVGFITDMLAVGAKSIWADSSEATLVGTPSNIILTKL